MEYLSGVVERITYTNEENGFSVIKIKSKGYYDLVTVVGNIATINVGAVVKLKGEWKVNSQYGKQFSVVEYEETLPATVKGIEKYLGSGLIKGIGPVNAKRIVKHFKEETIRIIEEEVDRLIEVDGIGEKRIDMIKKAWEEQKEVKNIMLFLQSHGISTSYAIKIYKAYKNESIDIVKQNPYRLADDIWGIGFKTADQIAQHMGFNENSYERCRAGIIYTLNDMANDGHCFGYREELVENTKKLLNLEESLIINTIQPMIKEGSIILEEEAIYLPAFYNSEKGVVSRIKEIIQMKSPYENIDITSKIQDIQRKNKITYDEIQIEAIKTAIRSKVMVLTGGPGTGKTTITLAIINILEELGGKILLAAPTGRAAKRMSETTKKEAKTIHRLLEFKPPNGYEKNKENPLDCNVLVVDESSMIDIIMMNTLLKAVKNETIVIFVGDVDQLPSVGAGKVLKDMIESNVINVVKLERIFRQALGSKIITNAHKINKGIYPNLQNDKKADFFFIEEEEPEKIVENIKNLCAKRLPKYYNIDKIKDIQVITPMQRGLLGTLNLNNALQEILNPNSISVKYGGIEFREQDKVMQIKNNYDKNVFNGDIGRIKNIDMETKVIIITFDEIDIPYDLSDMNEVVLAYATTVHKSQGSEYPVVVAPISMQHFMMLQRNLLYTCITRAKKIFISIGNKKAIGISIQNNKIVKRNTLLCEKLIEMKKNIKKEK